jgi:hypothetical protein
MMKKNPTLLSSGREWTRGGIYLDGASSMMPMPPRMVPNLTPNVAARIYCPEFLAALRAAPKWIPLDSPTLLSRDEIAAMVNRGIPCPVCQRHLAWLRYQDETTGIVICWPSDHQCERYVQVGNLWRKLVPRERYRGIRLESLEPDENSKLPLIKQAEYIATFRQHPDSSYLMCGRALTGKTYFAHALLYRAVERWSLAWAADDKLGDQSVFWIDHTGVLLDDIQQYKLHRRDVPRPKHPAVTAEEINRLQDQGQRVTLCLDEVDKFSATEPRLTNLHELLLAIDAGRSQVVAMSNATQTLLRKKWAEFPSLAEPIIRRLCGAESDGRYLQFRIPRDESGGNDDRT